MTDPVAGLGRAFVGDPDASPYYAVRHRPNGRSRRFHPEPQEHPLQAKHHAAFFRSVAREFEARSEHLRFFVNNRWALGTYKELILSQFLSERLSPTFLVVGGFFDSPDRSSHQHDILVVDPTTNCVTFYHGVIAVVPPTATRIALEVKSRVSPSDLQAIFDKANDAQSRHPQIFTIGYVFPFRTPKDLPHYVRQCLAQIDGPQTLPNLICLPDEHFLWKSSNRQLAYYHIPRQSSIQTLYTAIHSLLYDTNSTPFCADAEPLEIFDFELSSPRNTNGK